jgi:hypothetical protein
MGIPVGLISNSENAKKIWHCREEPRVGGITHIVCDNDTYQKHNAKISFSIKSKPPP